MILSNAKLVGDSKTVFNEHYEARYDNVLGFSTGYKL